MTTGGVRRRARGYALQLLYWLDLNPDGPVDEAVRRFWDTFEVQDDPEAVSFASQLTLSTRAALPEVDEIVQTASRNWRLDRMSRVDRNILRLATWELRGAPEVPVRVVINEAVELARRFGAKDSPGFVNGILDKIGRMRNAE